MAKSRNWTREEFDTTVEAYLWMLKQQQEGKPYKKTDVNKSLRQGALKIRSRASIEYRMRNISSVMEEMNQPLVNGYLPAKNVGDNGTKQIKLALEVAGVKFITDFEPTADETELDRRVSKLRKKRMVEQPKGQDAPVRSVGIIRAFVRDPAVKAWVLQNAGDHCEACGGGAPFATADGQPYFEVHHIRSLGANGTDKISNAVALCPNCHRRCHHSSDRETFTREFFKKISRLISE